MLRRRALRLTLTWLAAALVVVLVAVVVVVQVFLRRPFPEYEGTVALTGMDGTVRVLRDEQGVPQIYATTTGDLFRALGYVHAQDRFFEMDVRRHVTAGRLSELVGESTDALEADAVVRTLGWRRVAEQEMSLLSSNTRAVLDAYSAGVNAYLGDRGRSELAVEYTVLGLSVPLDRIEPWSPVDSLTWLKALAWDLRANYADELDRARAFGAVRDVRRVEQLWPAYPADRHAPIVGAAPAEQQQGSRVVPTARTEAAAPAADVLDVLAGDPVRAAFDATDRALRALPGLVGADTGEIGSNSWVVSGRFTASGKPLLANDPHLRVSAPGIWYQVGLHCEEVGPACPYDVSGFGMSGLPGVVVGHNGSLAWGVTNMYADVTDFYLEQVSGDTYLRDGDQVPLTTREETIEVAGGDPVTIEVRSTVHGPVVSDVVDAVAAVGGAGPARDDAPLRGQGYAVSLAWSALTPNRTMDALLAIDTATDAESFREAASLLAVPAQNLVFATTDGTIGYQAPGLVPVRRGPSSGSPVPVDGTWPLPGWDSRYDWAGWLPYERLPAIVDPPEGFVVAANQAVVAPRANPGLGRDTDYGDRAQRIRDLLETATAAGGLTPADMTAIQTDTRNEIAPDLVPLLLETDVDAFTAQAQDLLRDWQPGYAQDTDSAAAAYFNAVWAKVLDLTVADELPDGVRATGGSRWFEVVRTLLETPDDPWWDDRGTANLVETRDEILRQALVDARLDLTSNLGKDPSRWQWGRLHTVRLQHTPLGGEGIPGPVRDLVNVGRRAAPGGTSAVDAFAWDASSGTYEVTSGPSMRMVVDLGDLDASTWVNQTGVSGHPSDDHYDDQVDAWLEGSTFPWPWSRDAVEESAEHTLVLRPTGDED